MTTAALDGGPGTQEALARRHQRPVVAAEGVRRVQHRAAPPRRTGGGPVRILRQFFWAFVDIWEALKNQITSGELWLRVTFSLLAGVGAWFIAGAILDKCG
jgi:hypothetical protein